MNKSVGKRVRQLRLQKELSQLELAEKAGVTANTLRGLEKGTLNTRWPKLQKIARALGTTPEILVHGDEQIQPTDPLIAGLNREDFEIARAYHECSTIVRQRIQTLVREREPPATTPTSEEAERTASELAHRIVRLSKGNQIAIESLVMTLEGRLAETDKPATRSGKTLSS